MTLPYPFQFCRVRRDNFLPDGALWWEVHPVAIRCDFVVASLPKSVVINSTGEVAPVIAVRGVAIHRYQLVVTDRHRLPREVVELLWISRCCAT
jgi:hypothetical protein